MTEENKEEVLVHTKIQNPNKPKVAKLNEAHATMDIAKSLIQDYTFLLTMSVIKTMFAQIRNSDDVLKDIYNVWEQRMSAQLAEETENYKKAITDAFQGSEVNITEEVTNSIKEYFDCYCRVRDNAVKMAKEGIKDINKLIKNEPEKTQQEK